MAMGQARQYLLSFLATIQGDKAVVRGVRQMESSLNKYKKEAGIAGGKTQNFNDILKKAGSRALLVAPVWLILRSAMMLVIRTIGNMVRANLDLQDGMARIRTVMQGTSAEINANMAVIERKIRDVASKTSVSLKELAEAFYFLKTANLTAKEAMAGFEPVLNAMVGTGNSAKDMARAVAGMYNTMANQMDDTMTVTEKMTKIADVLTYTYATQDVQMSELTSSYTKLAPYVAGLDDSFTDLVTMLGYLNTRLLRAGRTGRLTGRAILQLSKNAKQLAHEFGVTFDPDKPISFIKTLEKINAKMSGAVKLTAQEGQALQRVFATRGGVAIRLLLQDFDDFTENLKRAREEADGFAKTMADIRMNTVSAQMKRMENNLANLSGEFYAGAIGAGDVVESLKELNNTLDSLRTYARGAGDLLGWMAYNLAQISVGIDFVRVRTSQWKQVLSGMIPSFSLFLKQTLKYNEAVQDMKDAQIKPLSFAGYSEKQLKLEQEVTDRKAEQTKEVEKLNKKQQEGVKTLKDEKEEQSHIVNLLKTAGAHALDIARYKLDALETSSITREDEEYRLEFQKRENDLLEAQATIRQKIRDNLMSAEADLLKTMGASELQILNHKKQQIEANRESMGQAEYLLSLAENRKKVTIAIAKEVQKEENTMANLAMQYEKADESERKKLKRFFELRKLDPEDLAQEWKNTMFDKEIITKYWSAFSSAGKRAVGEVIDKERGLGIGKKRKGGIYPFETSRMEGEARVPTIPGDFEQKLTQDIPKTFWETMTNRGDVFLQRFAERFGLMGTPEAGFIKPTYAPEKDKAKEAIRAQFAKLGITIPIENIEITLPEDSLERVAEEAGKQIEEKLKNSEELAKKIAKIIRPHI